MAGDNAAVGGNESGVGKSDCLDAAGDLRDLRVTMRAGIARRRDEPRDRPNFQTQSINGGYCVSVAHFLAPLNSRLIACLSTPPPPLPPRRQNFFEILRKCARAPRPVTPQKALEI